MQPAWGQAGFVGWQQRCDAPVLERVAALVGLVALGLGAVAAILDTDAAAVLPPFAAMAANGVSSSSTSSSSASSSVGAAAGHDSLAARETRVGGYLGVTYTHPSTVTIKNDGRTDMTVRDFGWEGKPFKSPIYYGLRAIRWAEGGRVGAMLDFTHAKTISRFEDVGTFTGTYEGKPLPPKARVGDAFKHLEFSHGHNMLTLNGIARLGAFPIQPYVGAGAGISLPHTEIAFRTEPGRTYEYQYAGLTGQVLVGLEVPLGRTSVFLEYKLSYSPYDVPLSGVVNGHYLFTDLWRQFRAWIGGEKPPGGRLTTPLLTHHGIGGVMLRVGAPSRVATR